MAHRFRYQDPMDTEVDMGGRRQVEQEETWGGKRQAEIWAEWAAEPALAPLLQCLQSAALEAFQG